MIKYELKNGNVLKDGHTMFLQDVVSDLNRGAFLESERTKQQSLPIDSVSNFVLLAKPNYKAKDGTIKRGIEIDSKYYAPKNDC